MVLVNEMMDEEVSQENYEVLLRLLSPFAPHITEELWEQINSKLKTQNSKLLVHQPWPSYDPSRIVDNEITYIIQVNAKMRDQITTEATITEDELSKLALASVKVQTHVKGAKPKQVIFVKGRLMNLVI